MTGLLAAGLVGVAVLAVGCMTPPGLTLEQRERACHERGGTWTPEGCRR